MATLSDLRLRFWIVLARRVIFFIDETLPLIRRLRPGGPPAGTRRPHPIIQPVSIPAAHGQLDARLCRPAHPSAAILVCHGIGDRLFYWQNVQLLLEQHSVASLIFDYAGYGTSTGSLSAQVLREDTQSAYAHLRATLPDTPIFVLGFSMGTGVAADALPHLTPAPAGLILCQPFISLRAAAAQITRSPLLSRLIPDVWNTAASLPDLTVPLLIVHGDADRLLPLHHAHTLHAAAHPSTTLAIPHGFSHPDGYLTPTLTYWEPVLNFIKLHMH